MMTDDQTGSEEPRRTCPACGAPVSSVRDVGPVTWELEPCGHQIDDRIHDEFWTAQGGDTDSP